MFALSFGDTLITEDRVQKALAQFVRSIESFDSKYDVGRAQVANDGANFPNFTQQENLGKQLFLLPPQFMVDTLTFINGLGQAINDTFSIRTGPGLGCAECHRPPEFDIDPNSLGNGIERRLDSPGVKDSLIARAPTLRDIINPDGSVNSQFFHTGSGRTGPQGFNAVINHYNRIRNDNNIHIDNRLIPNGFGQFLDMNQTEKEALTAFMKTLTGNNVYTDEKWSNPFGSNGGLTIENGVLRTEESKFNTVEIYPNPVLGNVFIKNSKENSSVEIYSISSRLVVQLLLRVGVNEISLHNVQSGSYIVRVLDENGKKVHYQKLLVQ